MYERLDERIAVAAIFGTAHKDVQLYKFKRRGREYLVSKVTYVHKLKEGTTLYHVFSATDGANYYEIHFNTNDLSWTIGRTSDGEVK